jgi:hypothetical protein
MIFAALFGHIGPVDAGGIDFGPDDQPANTGPVYLGVVTDQNGAAVPDAKITVKVPTLNATVVQRADSQGHFFVQAFDKSVNPKDVDIACSQDGYQNAEATKDITSDPTAPVNAVCSLHKN